MLHGGEEWLCFNVVDGVYEITSSTPMGGAGELLPLSSNVENGEIVIIGEDLKIALLHELFGGVPVEEEGEDEE